MKYQNYLDKVSSLPNAYNLREFVKYDTSTRTFEFFGGHSFFTHSNGNWSYNISVYGFDQVIPMSVVGLAFTELSEFILKYTDSHGILLSNALSEYNKLRAITPPLNPWVASKAIGGSDYTKEYEPSNPLFCSCSSPTIVKSRTLQDEFDYCKCCKKEHKASVVPSNDWEGYKPF